MKTRGIFEKVPGSGVWWIRYVDADGRYRREKAGTKSAARALYLKRKNEALEGRKLPEKLRQRAVTFREIATDALAWSDEHKRSADNDHRLMKKPLAWFGDRSAASIAPAEIEARFQAEPWKPATWNRYRALLSLAYRLAMRPGADGKPPKVSANPARMVKHKTENNCRIRFLSPEEEKELRAAIASEFSKHMPEFDLVLHTGLRRSEQYGARWEHVDWERRILTVPLDKGGQRSHVPLNEAALRALMVLRGQHGETDLVWGGVKGPRHWFAPALRKAKIADFHWHDLRHTFASRLVMSGADVRTVAELLRDRTLEMAMRYAHLAPDYKLEAVRRMESKFRDQTGTTVAPEPKRARASVN